MRKKEYSICQKGRLKYVFFVHIYITNILKLYCRNIYLMLRNEKINDTKKQISKRNNFFMLSFLYLCQLLIVVV